MRSSSLLTLPALSLLLSASAADAGDASPRGAFPASVPTAVQDVLDTPRGGRDPSTVQLDAHWRNAAKRWAARDGMPEADALERTRQRLAANERQREATQGAPILTVGGDPACDFQDTPGSNGLQTALDAAATDVNGADLTIVRVARSGFYQGRRYFINDPVQGDQDVTVEGGYDDCADSTINGQTIIDLNGAAGPGISIFESAVQQTVRLEHLTVRGASSTTSDGGALAIADNNFVILDFVSLLSNSAGRGGAVFIDDAGSGNTFLWLLGSNVIRFNSAETEGGGIWCNQSQSVVLDDMVLLADNNAETGGGIFTEFGCIVTSYASAPAGILDNIAAVDGGGVYMDGNGDTVTVIGGENSFFGFGDATVPALVDGNRSGRSGAGIYSSGSGSEFSAFDAHITNNVAETDTSDSFLGVGGGIMVFAGGSATVDRTLDAVDCHSPIRCSQIAGNTARFGSAVYGSAANNSIDIRQTFITGNLQPPVAPSGTVITFTGGPTNGASLLFEGNVIAGNSNAAGQLDTILLNNIESATVAYTTITDNHDQAEDRSFELNNTTDIDLYSSIVHENVGLVFQVDPGGTITSTIDCVNLQETGSLPSAGSGLEVAPPRLGIEYTLTPNSPALDTCDTFLYSPQEPDIGSVARGLDLTAIDNRFGPYDLGAWEFPTQIQPGVIEFRNGVVEFLEQDIVFNITVDRVGGSDGELQVGYLTQSGTATAGDDFQPLNDSLTWAAGDGSSKQIQLVLIDDGAFEGTETLTVTLSTQNELTRLGSPATLVFNIFDDEVTLFADGFEGG